MINELQILTPRTSKSSSVTSPGELIISAQGQVKTIHQPDKTAPITALPKLDFHLDDVSHLHPISLNFSHQIEATMLGKTRSLAVPPVQVTVPENTQPEVLPYEVAERAIKADLRGFDRGTMVLPRVIPVDGNLLVILKESYKESLAKLLHKEGSLTEVETSGRIRLSKLSKPIEYRGNWVRSREIEKLEFTGEGNSDSVALLDEGYAPGEIDFHVHIIDPKEGSIKDDHITLADVGAILDSSPWFDPDNGKPNPNYRVHCIISVMKEKSLWRTHGRAVFGFFIMDLQSESAQQGHPPYGLRALRRTILVEF